MTKSYERWHVTIPMSGIYMVRATGCLLFSSAVFDGLCHQGVAFTIGIIGGTFAGIGIGKTIHSQVSFVFRASTR